MPVPFYPDSEYTDKQALALLTTAAKYMLDEDSQNNYDENIHDIGVNQFTKKELNNAIEYLKTNSQGQYFIDTYKESMKAQPYFTATKEQKEDNDWTPDFTVDLYNQGVGPIFLPTRVGTVIGNGVKEVSPIIIGGTGQLYDDVTLKAISKAYNIAPNLTSKYILNNTKINESIIDGITDYYLLGIPSNSKVGYLIGGYGLVSDYLDKNKDNK
ncbi:hypothetical protein CRV08_03615 [Halarcobacter ebronensis]|uniref:Uncharacterized protein n=1 Tax=Halarcobacter ebronensis TaxID=1462615 RepID=A0A4Q0YF21_9BACT|nr:hypothetical protein [Halarcobacter ebronensis]RXJ69110.1 hypothetical protein CRV08_03615 [Halarcobacter ebronensis]